MTRASPEDFSRVASLDEIYGLLATLDIENGWAKKEPSMWARPRRSFVPAHWSYRPAKAALDAASRFVNTELAERRNLILVNPIPGNTYPTVRTLVAAYQMVKAGETARSHRHSANALRLVLDTAPGTFTIVDGSKIPMVAGDVLLTPNWCWHAHANQSPSDAYWMDILDVPTVQLLDPMFFEHHEAGLEPVTNDGTASSFRFAFADTVRRLSAAPEIAPGCCRIELQSPGGAPAMATIALHVARIEPGASLPIEPTTSSAVVAVMAGSGSIKAGEASFDWSRGDALALPAGVPASVTAQTEAYVLTASDQPLLKALGWLRAMPLQA